MSSTARRASDCFRLVQSLAAPADEAGVFEVSGRGRVRIPPRPAWTSWQRRPISKGFMVSVCPSWSGSRIQIRAALGVRNAYFGRLAMSSIRVPSISRGPSTANAPMTSKNFLK
jgi:hypothetical protein